jgi:alpha-glucosidase (family GH31 glycosyl hydrolase)
MMGDGPNTVTTLYQTVVGKPVMVPQWSLGWNQGRYGYTNLDAVKESVKNFSDYDLPLDT